MMQIDPKKVYAIPIAQVRISKNRIRWRLADVQAFFADRTVQPDNSSPPHVRLPAAHPARARSAVRVQTRFGVAVK